MHCQSTLIPCHGITEDSCSGANHSFSLRLKVSSLLSEQISFFVCLRGGDEMIVHGITGKSDTMSICAEIVQQVRALIRFGKITCFALINRG